VKVIDKSRLDPVARAHLFQEVRCMKLVQHPNVVRLYEVIDTQTKLYLILELGDGGDMYDCIMKHDGGLTEEVCGGWGSVWVWRGVCVCVKRTRPLVCVCVMKKDYSSIVNTLPIKT
jgi:hypothetical protein